MNSLKHSRNGITAAYIFTSVCHSQPRYYSRTTAVRVQCYRNSADLAPVLPRGLHPDCQAGSCISCQSWNSRSVFRRGLCSACVVRRLQPVIDVTPDRGIHCHQHADDTQLHDCDNTARGLSVVAACSADVSHHRRRVVRVAVAPLRDPGDLRSP